MDRLVNRKQAITGLLGGHVHDDLPPLERPKNGTEVRVIAHRAAGRGCPENSLCGIRAAAREGVDIVEVDVRRTVDGVPVLLHDRTLRRTATGLVPVRVQPAGWATRRRLLSVPRSNVQTDERVPTLRQALYALPEGVEIGIHVKDRWALGAVLGVVERSGDAGRTWLWLERAGNVGVARERLSGMRVVLLNDWRREREVRRYLAVAEKAGATAVSVPWGRVTADVTVEAHGRSLLVFAMERGLGEVAEMAAAGLDGVITDRPVMVAEVLAAMVE